MEYDCFISVILRIIEEFKLTESKIPFLTMTYNFHYNHFWESLSNNIICTFDEKQLINGIDGLGITCKIKDNMLNQYTTYNASCEETIIIKVDGYYCPWHLGYKLYHVNHYMILKKIVNNDVYIYDPYFSKEEIIICKSDLSERIITWSVFSKNSNRICNKIHYINDYFCDIRKSYIENLKKFSDDYMLFYTNLLECDDDFNSIQFFRDIKMVILCKKTLETILEYIYACNKQISIAKSLKNKWNFLLNKFMYTAISKRDEKESLRTILTEILENEIQVFELFCEKKDRKNE